MFFFKQKTAYEMRISDWSSDVCSSDLGRATRLGGARGRADLPAAIAAQRRHDPVLDCMGVFERRLRAVFRKIDRTARAPRLQEQFRHPLHQIRPHPPALPLANPPETILHAGGIAPSRHPLHAPELRSRIRLSTEERR